MHFTVRFDALLMPNLALKRDALHLKPKAKVWRRLPFHGLLSEQAERSPKPSSNQIQVYTLLASDKPYATSTTGGKGRSARNISAADNEKEMRRLSCDSTFDAMPSALGMVPLPFQ